ncbi:vitrin-like [Babylonia areolata]|uniref:vitrin-like n=1 Tax=Babylonia areolata TaxID=304850 RepID=UPI003FD14A64
MRAVICLALTLVLASQAAFLSERQKRASPDCPEECTSKPLEISFVVDASASIWPGNFIKCLTFIEDFTGLFKISPEAVRVSLVTFGERAYSEDAFGLSTHGSNQDLKAAIASIVYRSGVRTNTAAGIRFMLEHHLPEIRQGVRHVAIVITDGQSQEKNETKMAANAAHTAGVEVFAVGVGHKVSIPELHNIASDNRHVFTVTSYDVLESIKKRLAYEACDVPSYPECEMDPVDLSFVIDSSVSIGKDNFTAGMDFVKNFVDSFQVSQSAVRVSAVTFGEDVNLEDAFDFDTHESKKDVLDRLQRIPWRHGTRTNTGAGIAYMRDMQMPKARASAAHVCIVLTDGKSQEVEETRREAAEAKTDGIVMYAVGVGKLGQQLDLAELNNIASDPSKVLTVDNYSKLNLIKENLINVTCQGILASIHAKGNRLKLQL